MFYLKYRPINLEQLDNTRVREVVSQLLKSKNLPHALSFIGGKGMGKTSVARIFAKAVNCENNLFAGKNSEIDPCNQCAQCKSIDNGSSPDITEMDAASNRGIEEVKQLMKEAAFAPLSARYRVFIIDEAHMITNDAFNALLKTLEEPPSTVIFILATTNEEKIPKTILSRCYRIGFGLADKSDIQHMLKRIVAGENLKITQALADLIADNSDYSFRDAAKLLEELTIQNKLNFEEAQAYLGIRVQNNLLYSLMHSSLDETINWIKHYQASGGNIKIVIEDTLQQLHNHLINPESIKDKQMSRTDLATCMRVMLEAYANLKISPIETIPLEIAVIEFYNQRKSI